MALRRSVHLAFFLIAGTSPVFAQSDGSPKEKSGNEQPNPSSFCAERLRAFIEEMDKKLETSTTVYPLQETLKKYFPVFGCNIEEAVSIVKASKYFYSVDRFPLGDVVIVFRKKAPYIWGYEVSFGLNRTGNSVLPNASVDMNKL